MDASTKYILGRNVRAMRTRLGLTKTRLCLMAGISRPLLDTIERGEGNITISTLSRIAEALGVEPWALIRGSGDTDNG